MKLTMKVTGFRELDAALGQLPKATAKSVMQRTLAKAGEPIMRAAQANAPVDKGELRDSITVGTRIANTVGKAEFAAVMRGGGTRGQAVSALRNARRSATGGSFAVVFVGPAKAKSKKNAIKRIVQEFGSNKQAPQPYLRPAWDAEKMNTLDIIKREMGNEIIRAAKRLGSSKRFTATVKQSASIAALMANEFNEGL